MYLYSVNDFTKFDKEIKTDLDGKEVITMVKMATCNHCGFETNANSKHGTTHFKNHLKACPKKKKVDVCQQLIQATVRKEDGTLTLQNYQFDDAKSQKLLIKAIIAHEYPFNFVEQVFTRDYLLSLRPAHHLSLIHI